MGAKYTSKSASGYNSTPPSDNGAQTAANLVKWSTHKTKLTDPIKTLAEDINTALVTAFDFSVRQITSSDSTVAGDHMRCVEIAPSVTAAVTVSLGDAATMGSVYRVYIKNSSARNQTLGRATVADTIDGTAGNVTLPPGGGVIVQTNATPDGYLVIARHGPLVDSDALAVGSADGTKKVRLEVDGVTAATTRVLTVPDFDGTIATLAGTEALTNKTINLSSNTLTGTTAQFNTALSDGDFATLAGTEALTNKTLTSPTINGTVTTTGITISGGSVNLSSQPAFLAINSVADSDVTGDGTVYQLVCDTEVFDQASNYNAGTGTFTAPVTGRYIFTVEVAFQQLAAGHTGGAILVQTSNRNHFLLAANLGAIRDSSNELFWGGTVYCDMEAGDTAIASVYASGSTKTVDLAATNTRFGGSLQQ